MRDMYVVSCAHFDRCILLLLLVVRVATTTTTNITLIHKSFYYLFVWLSVSCVQYTEILKQVCVWLWNKCISAYGAAWLHSQCLQVSFTFLLKMRTICVAFFIHIFISIFVFVRSLHAFERRRLWCCLKIELLLCHVTVNWVVKHREVEGCGTFHVKMMSMTQNIMRIWQVFLSE